MWHKDKPVSTEIVVKHDTVDLVDLIECLINHKIYMSRPTTIYSQENLDKLSVIKQEIADCLRERDTRPGVVAG